MIKYPNYREAGRLIISAGLFFYSEFSVLCREAFSQPAKLFLMKIEFRVVGKTHEAYLREGIEIYHKRIGHYLPYAMEVLPDIKQAGKLSPEQLKDQEGKMILQKINPDDCLILLDEKGKTFTSVQFAGFLSKLLQQPYKRIIFQVGGAFGFSQEVYQRANNQLSLSDMTFSHQMIRLFFTEQLYRAMTIIRNEKYHNEG